MIILTVGLSLGLQVGAACANAVKSWRCYTSCEHTPKPWSCYWTRGRLWIAQGGPSIRLWPVGTRRILGIVNPKTGVTDVDEADALPPGVAAVLTDDVFVWGNYHVCPIVAERTGWMRFAVIDRVARELFVQKK